MRPPYSAQTHGTAFCCHVGIFPLPTSEDIYHQGSPVHVPPPPGSHQGLHPSFVALKTECHRPAGRSACSSHWLQPHHLPSKPAGVLQVGLQVPHRFILVVQTEPTPWHKPHPWQDLRKVKPGSGMVTPAVLDQPVGTVRGLLSSPPPAGDAPFTQPLERTGQDRPLERHTQEEETPQPEPPQTPHLSHMGLPASLGCRGPPPCFPPQVHSALRVTG